MQLMTPELREQLIANGSNRDGDPPSGSQVLHPRGCVYLVGQRDGPRRQRLLVRTRGFRHGVPRNGRNLAVPASELPRAPFGLGIERDLYFQPQYPIRIYAAAARSAQRIVDSGPLLEAAAREAGLPVAAEGAAADSNGHRDAVRESAVRSTGVRSAASLGALPEGHNRHRDALLIVDPGACNPSGVALSLHNACRQVIAEGGDQRTDPAVRLIVSQLSFLTNSHADLDTAEYGKLIEACRKKAGASAP